MTLGKAAAPIWRWLLKSRGSRVLAETGSDYLFTVVVPIYNVEPYLEETLDSIVGQTVGFRDNIQLVLVNDGSPDDSGAICRRYLERYPENVVYVEQENAGVSAACNAGLALARGAFVNFMGADDKWSEGAFEEAAKFFEEHPSVSLVSYRMIYFEAATGDHILNFKYSGGTQVIDIQRKYDCPQIEGGAVIMRREAIPADAFRGKLAFQEDTRLVSDVILTSGNYGALSGSSYYYRKRLAATAATDHSTRGYDWHFNSLKGCHQELVNRSIKLYGEIIPYVQFIIMYDLQWRLGHDPFVAGLDRDLASRYKKEIVDLLRLVDDRIIVRQRNIPLCEKLYALSLRHGISFSEAQHCLRIADGQVYFFPPLNSEVKELRPMTWMTSLDEASKVIIHITELKDGKLRLVGTVNSLFPIGSTRFHAAVNGSMQEIPLVCWSHTGSISSFCERDYFCFPSFDVEIPLRDFTQIAFSLSLGDETCKAMPVFCRFTFLSTVKSYHYEQPYLVTRTSDGMGITVERKSVSKEEHLMLEKRYVDSVPKHIINRQLKRLRKKGSSVVSVGEIPA